MFAASAGKHTNCGERGKNVTDGERGKLVTGRMGEQWTNFARLKFSLNQHTSVQGSGK